MIRISRTVPCDTLVEGENIDVAIEVVSSTHVCTYMYTCVRTVSMYMYLYIVHGMHHLDCRFT